MEVPSTTNYDEFCENPADHLSRLRKAKRPTVVLRKGRAQAVLLTPAEFADYAAARETLDLMGAIERGRREHGTGQTIPWGRARRELLARFERRLARKAE